MSDDEDENSKDWGREKTLSLKKPKKKEYQGADDGFRKERRTQQWMEGLSRLFHVILPMTFTRHDDQSQMRQSVIAQFELTELRRRMEETNRQNHMVVLELDRANLENRRIKLQLENVKAMSQLRLERAELETEKVKFCGQKEKAEQLIELLKMRQEIEQVKRESQTKSAEIEALKSEVQRLKAQPLQTDSSGDSSLGALPPARGMPYLSSGMQFLAMQHNTQLLQGMMAPQRNSNSQRTPRIRASAQGDGFCVCAQCMVAEFPNNLEGQRMLEIHLNTEHPNRGALTAAPVASNDCGSSEFSIKTSNGNT